ncbi:MAG: mismatch-specific DNA-glycosylase, partial [Gammaproteobacteria bacterium]|nr:mismatch-specific DNA-glycosylase [Gammaproteobacteria bacterium]
DPAAVMAKVRRYRPRWLAFVGKRPARVVLDRSSVGYGVQPERLGRTRLFVLPSPSPRAAGYWDVAWWLRLAALRRR